MVHRSLGHFSITHTVFFGLRFWRKNGVMPSTGQPGQADQEYWWKNAQYADMWLGRFGDRARRIALQARCTSIWVMIL